MAFDTIRASQPKVVQLLENSIKRERLSHAYLFEGAKGSKKFETAIYFAQMLLCKSEDKPCQTCSNCKRIAHHTHPNVYIVEPVKNSIRKQQIIDLQIEFSKTSVEPGKKIYIIKNIEDIQVGAANSLLKFLEEPHPNIVGILTTSNINRLLSTIISRSQIVSFTSISPKVVEQEMIEAGYEPSTARIIASLGYNFDDSIDIANGEFYNDVATMLIDIFDMIAENSDSSILYFKENGNWIFADNEISELFLSLMIQLQKDILNYQAGDSHLIFTDQINTISALAQLKPKNRLIDELEHMLALKGRSRSYINQRLAYDNLLYNLERR
jgi:DNA polymerase-3 subunit delta'